MKICIDFAFTRLYCNTQLLFIVPLFAIKFFLILLFFSQILLYFCCIWSFLNKKNMYLVSPKPIRYLLILGSKIHNRLCDYFIIVLTNKIIDIIFPSFFLERNLSDTINSSVATLFISFTILEEWNFFCDFSITKILYVSYILTHIFFNWIILTHDSCFQQSI